MFGLYARRFYRVFSAIFIIFIFSIIFSLNSMAGKVDLSVTDKAVTDALAPTLMTAPVYELVKGSDGGYVVNTPPGADRRSARTDVAIAILSYCAGRNVEPEGFERFFSDQLGGSDLKSCRLTRPVRYSGGYRALYLGQDNELKLLTFSSVKPEGQDIFDVILRFSDNMVVGVNVEDIEQIPEKYLPENSEVFIMKQELIAMLRSGSPGKQYAEKFFLSGGFHSIGPEALADVVNAAIEDVGKGVMDPEIAIEALRAVMLYSAEIITDTEDSRKLQLIAGQGMTILSWMERGVIGAGGIRVTTSIPDSVCNDKRGYGYIDRSTLPDGAKEVKEEGAPGFYWRGIEAVNKLGENIPAGHIVEQGRFDGVAENLIMYLMDHGFISVNDDILDMTKSGRLSTIHETFFMADTLPGSFQTTSTGPGHFQGMKLDMKNVTEGRGVQVNVQYGTDGKIKEIIAQEVKAGDWTVALPGCVDYMINLGGLRFNDMSVTLDRDTAEQFNPGFHFRPENVEEVAKAVGMHGKYSPYLAVKSDEGSFVFRNMSDLPGTKWLPPMTGAITGYSLAEEYPKLDRDGLDIMLGAILEGYNAAYREYGEESAPAMLEDGQDLGRMTTAPSMSRTEDIDNLIDDNISFLSSMLGKDAAMDKLIRIPVEVIDNIGIDAVKNFISVIDRSERGYIELYSVKTGIEVATEKYAELGIENKSLPEGFYSSRENTVTLMGVIRTDKLTAKGGIDGNWCIGNIAPTDTIISPIGMKYDPAGMIRGLIFGLKLSEIARQEAAGELDDAFLGQVFDEYRAFCFSQGVARFDLHPDDIVQLATGDINHIVRSLNRLIASLPIVPLNAEEIKELYLHARKALIAA